MTQPTEITRAAPAASVWTDGQLDPARCVAAALGVLRQGLPEGMGVNSITLDLAPTAVETEDDIRLAAIIEKSTRSVAFTSVKASNSTGDTIFTVRALCAFIEQSTPVATG